MSDMTSTKRSFWDRPRRVIHRVGYALSNPTFLYIVKRILSSLLTLMLLVAVVTALIRLMPDTKFYDVKTYNKIKGGSGIAVAENWKNHQLYLYGIRDLDGNPRSVFTSIFTYIYWILPIPKIVPTAWKTWDCDMILNPFIGGTYFGRSISYALPVTQLLTDKMGISFVISIISTILAYLISVPFGIAMAKKPGGVADKIGNIFVVLNYAIPGLVFYLVMNQWFSTFRGADGLTIFGKSYNADKWWSLIPPIACVVFLSIPGIALWVRRFMVDELSSDYVKFARSKGLSERTIMYKHVFRNACVPLIRNLPAVFIGAIVGSYYIEQIWTIPGTGALLTRALQGASPDTQLIQGLTVIYAAMSMVSFLLGDIVTIFFDPRIKLIAE